eukprot:TRINITY_DN15762_c0_g1_i1.p1 TRINITY_DN15762_c0_g1~~TRINITY_DN15762_c0_g1_i1.p1  ORF type:complete len:177 (-),score=40.86 TRINITY_DN15762_c0_g1_i1:88-618(-)
MVKLCLNPSIAVRTSFYGSVMVKNTFIHVDDADTAEHAFPHSNSWPCLRSACLREAMLPETESAKSNVGCRDTQKASLTSSRASSKASGSTQASCNAQACSDDSKDEVQGIEPALSLRMVQAHEAGTCKPCSYYFFKPDGCRKGETCEFCHLCPKEVARKYKSSHKKAARTRQVVS